MHLCKTKRPVEADHRLSAACCCLQSHDLVVANGILREEAAELRRQLAIAHKTREPSWELWQ